MVKSILVACMVSAARATPPECGEAYAKDVSHDADAIAACKRCGGHLIYDGGMLDSIGMTYCEGKNSLATTLDCGEAYVEDVSHDPDAIAACKACKGQNAVLIYDMGMLDNIGMTYCAAQLSSPRYDDCGQAIMKDTTHDAAAIAACKACNGASAVLIWDASMADGLGYTYCAAQVSSAVALDCGEAYAKDVSHDAAAIAACKKCGGHLVYDGGMLDSIGMTYCEGKVSLATSLDCGEAVEDVSHDADAIAACKACKGENAVLIYDAGMADGLGYSYCAAQVSSAVALDCGEAYAKDVSHDADAIAACKKCGGHLVYDGGMLDSIGMTYCDGKVSVATPPACGEAYAKDVSHDADAIAACKACKGQNAVLIYDGGMLDSIGMTYCQAAHASDVLV